MRAGSAGGGIGGTIQHRDSGGGYSCGHLIPDAPYQRIEIDVEMLCDPRLHREPISDSLGCATGLVLSADLGGVIHRAGPFGDQAEAQHRQSNAAGEAPFPFRTRR